MDTKIVNSFCCLCKINLKDPFSCFPVIQNFTNMLIGETLPGITKDMDLTTYKVPLGVCAGIAPFNFPAMVPLW